MLIVRQTAPAGQHLPDSGGDQDFDKLFAQYRDKYFTPIQTL